VALSGAAIGILKDMASIRTNEFVFPSFDSRSRGPLNPLALWYVLRDMGETSATVHGFRSAFRDWAGEETNFPREICEAALAHSLRDKTEAAYRRGDALEKRRQLMEAWAAYCCPPEGAKILPMRRGAKAV
jgi:integrase